MSDNQGYRERKPQKRESLGGSCGRDLLMSSMQTRNEFPLLCVDVDEDVMTMRELTDFFTGPVPLYPASNPTMLPYVISADQMECRIRTLEKHMLLDLPAIYSSTDKDVLKDERTFSLCDGRLKQAIHHLGTVMDQVTENERHLLRNVCTYYMQLHKILGDPRVHESAYEDLFRSFCRLADVELHNGGAFTRNIKILNREISVTPDFRITTKRIMGMNQGPYAESTRVVAVVALKRSGQWAEPVKIHPCRRPDGFRLTAKMHDKLLAEMVADLEMSRCHGSRSNPDGLPLCMVGVSVFSTKICFSFLEFPVKQYNELTSADNDELVDSYRQAYRKRSDDRQEVSDDETPCKRAVLRVSECFDMTRKEDRAELLNILYMLGNIVE